MKINKELLFELVCYLKDVGEFKVVFDEIEGHSRWSVHYNCIIQNLTTGKFYDAYYSMGATEDQDESPFDCRNEDENGDIELEEVEPYEVMVTKYRKITTEVKTQK